MIAGSCSALSHTDVVDDLICFVFPAAYGELQTRAAHDDDDHHLWWVVHWSYAVDIAITKQGPAGNGRGFFVISRLSPALAGECRRGRERS